jgi:sec-independent protein translocase protein TatA
MFNFIKNLGPTELIIIGVILIVFFGAKRIAGLGKTGGEAVKEVKKIKKELVGAIDEAKKDTTKEVEG